MRWPCLILLVGCAASEPVLLTARPNASDGLMPPDVLPVVVADAWWIEAPREVELVKLPNREPVGFETIAYDNGVVLSPLFGLTEGGTFEVAGTRFAVDPAATGVAPEGPWPSELVEARIELDEEIITLSFAGTPPAPWYEVDLRISADCQLELIALGEVKIDVEEACDLERVPDSITVSQRAVDWNGERGSRAEPTVVLR